MGGNTETYMYESMRTSILRIECTSDDKHFYFLCKCHHWFRKNNKPPNCKLAMCIVSGIVVKLRLFDPCSCMACKTGYCNHSFALTLKIWKWSLFESENTQDLVKILKRHALGGFVWLSQQQHNSHPAWQFSVCVQQIRIQINKYYSTLYFFKQMTSFHT